MESRNELPGLELLQVKFLEESQERTDKIDTTDLDAKYAGKKFEKRKDGRNFQRIEKVSIKASRKGKNRL